jgi:muramoyltetrapeptide carboxypeptidase LdcA involved in peptidoglycan recycling
VVHRYQWFLDQANCTRLPTEGWRVLQQAGAETVRALVIRRFQLASTVSREDLEALVADIASLSGEPVLANVDFGHTNSLMTFPVGVRQRRRGRRRCFTSTQH